MESNIQKAGKPMRFVVSSADDAPLVAGRRDWVQYRDLGIEDASGGLISTHRITVARPAEGEDSGTNKQTGWHYHDCQFQWVWLIEGWVEVQLEDGSLHRQEAGTVTLVPGGVGHNEVRTSERVDLIEIFMPPHPATVAIDTPEPWRKL